MVFLDFLFKLYFSFFSRYEKRGAEVAASTLMIPVTLNVYTILVVGLSFVIDLAAIGAFVFVVGLCVTGVGTVTLFRRIYVDNERYKNTSIQYTWLYRIACIFHVLFSGPLFAIAGYIVW